MNKVQRRLPANRSSSKKIKKLRSKLNINQKIISITMIEHLSHEIFYEIFDYLDGCDISQAFSNLNHRFQQLLDSSSLLFKIKSYYSESIGTYINNSEQIIFLNRHQILSINLMMPSHIDDFFLSFTIDSSLNHLESLVLNNRDPDVLMSILSKLSSLPRLFSLTIDMLNVLADLTGIYRTILALPMLKYYKFLIGDLNLTFSIPVATNKQFSPIEYLVIDHPCTFEQLSTIISYTPQLCHLNFLHINESNLNTDIISSMYLSNLTHLSIYVHYVKFVEFQMFISKLHSKLKILSFTTRHEDIAYLDADRWEKFILQYLPQLEKLYFRYYQYIDDNNESPICLEEQNQFSSRFWIKRHWIFEAEIDIEDIIYSIRPYSKMWYEYAQHPIINSSLQLSKAARLTLQYNPPNACRESLIQDVDSVLCLSMIYHLEIVKGNLLLGILVDLLYSLPELVSLKIYSLSLDKSKYLYRQEANNFCWISNRNSIRKVCLEKINDINEVLTLIELCSRMNYLQVNCINNIDIKLFVRDILNKINDENDNPLRSLGFCVPTADDHMVTELEKMIYFENLLCDFTIKRVMNKIYLQWILL